MNLQIQNWKREHDIAAIVAATFPEYRRTKLYVVPAESVTLYDLNWSGGTRAEYRACTIDGKPTGSLGAWNHVAPWNNKAEGSMVVIPPGHVIVRGGHFCGKPSALYIYVRPQDMPRRLSHV